MQPKIFEAAILDLDGALVLTEPAWGEGRRQVLAWLEVQVPQATSDV